MTFRPAMRYSPLTIACEKRPERSSPNRVAPFAWAAFWALASSDERFAFVSSSKVFATIHFLHTGRNVLTTRACVTSGGHAPLPWTPRLCRPCRARTSPTWGGGACWRAAGTISQAISKHTGELLVAHPGGPMPEILHQSQLLEREVVVEPREGAFEISPRLF